MAEGLASGETVCRVREGCEGTRILLVRWTKREDYPRIVDLSEVSRIELDRLERPLSRQLISTRLTRHLGLFCGLQTCQHDGREVFTYFALVLAGRNSFWWFDIWPHTSKSAGANS